MIYLSCNRNILKLIHFFIASDLISKCIYLLNSFSTQYGQSGMETSKIYLIKSNICSMAAKKKALYRASWFPMIPLNYSLLTVPITIQFIKVDE